MAEINQALAANANLNTKAKTYSKYLLKESMFNGQNLWVFKPNDFNRGKGVTLFRSLDELKRLIQDYTQGVEVKPLNQPPPTDTDEPQPKPTGFIIKSDVFVIQKYIERPLLILNRKFDIRMWALVAHDHRCYLFQEGYIRLSGHDYSLNEKDLDNLFIHLTNNAIQKKDKDYGKHEEGNQMSFKAASEHTGIDFHQLAKNEILPIVEMTLISARLKLNKGNRRFCFEIYGYDFMVDEQHKPWLIEVNTNPCLEESSGLLKQLIPRLLDDTFKLTLDVLYPPIHNIKHL